MFLVRDARADDLDDLLGVARFLDSVNLPADRSRLRELIDLSTESFVGGCDVSQRRYLFVLTDGDSGPVVGASMVFAQHGSRRAPHVYFDVLEEERYSHTLDVHVVHRILRIGYNYKGVTEIGGLVLLPELRRHPARLGRLLSYVRFVYLARHRPLFRDDVLSELMPPLEADGTSLLWEALGRRFTGLSYQEADRLSHENKEFIRALFPEEPIYATLLPAEVQSRIGQVGPATRGVERMLKRIGFAYAGRIDPFDGGPHFQARLEDIVPVRLASTASVTLGSTGGPAPPGLPLAELLLVSEPPDGQPGSRLRAMTSPAPRVGDVIGLSVEEARALRVAEGDEVGYLDLDRVDPVIPAAHGPGPPAPTGL
jgi:arginine N-succinyltransferase